MTLQLRRRRHFFSVKSRTKRSNFSDRNYDKKQEVEFVNILLPSFRFLFSDENQKIKDRNPRVATRPSHYIIDSGLFRADYFHKEDDNEYM